MPNRVIREGWIDSERIAELEPAEESFFLRLMLRADDYGRYVATPRLLRSYLFPLSETVTTDDVIRWLGSCERAGLVQCYEVEGKAYVEVVDFKQQLRTKKSKYPAPAKERRPRVSDLQKPLPGLAPTVEKVAEPVRDPIDPDFVALCKQADVQRIAEAWQQARANNTTRERLLDILQYALQFPGRWTGNIIFTQLTSASAMLREPSEGWYGDSKTWLKAHQQEENLRAFVAATKQDQQAVIQQTLQDDELERLWGPTLDRMHRENAEGLYSLARSISPSVAQLVRNRGSPPSGLARRSLLSHLAQHPPTPAVS